jgi:hypothetical protein
MDEFSEILDSPEKCLRFVDTFSLSSGCILPALFYTDLFAYHSRKARLARVITFPAARDSGGILPGFLQMYLDFLPWQFNSTQEQRTVSPINSITTHGPSATGVHNRNHYVGYGYGGEYLPSASSVTRPNAWDQFWHVDLKDLPSPKVDLRVNV